MSVRVRRDANQHAARTVGMSVRLHHIVADADADRAALAGAHDLRDVRDVRDATVVEQE